MVVLPIPPPYFLEGLEKLKAKNFMFENLSDILTDDTKNSLFEDVGKNWYNSILQKEVAIDLIIRLYS